MNSRRAVGEKRLALENCDIRSADGQACGKLHERL